MTNDLSEPYLALRTCSFVRTSASVSFSSFTMSQTITWSRSKSSSPYPVEGSGHDAVGSAASPGATPRTKSTTPSKIKRKQHFNVERAYQILNMHQIARQSGRWCLVNFLFVLFFYFGGCQSVLYHVLSLEHNFVRYIEIALLAVFMWNVGSNFYKYIKPRFSQPQVQLSSEQKTLLGISKEDEKLFAGPRPTQQVTPTRSATPGTSKGVTPPTFPMRRSPARSTSTSSTSALEYSPATRQSTGILGTSPGRSSTTSLNNHTSPGRSSTLYTPGSGVSRLTPRTGFTFIFLNERLQDALS